MLTAMEAAPFRAQKAFGTNDAGTVYADGAFVHVDGCRRRNRSRAHPTWPILLTFAIICRLAGRGDSDLPGKPWRHADHHGAVPKLKARDRSPTLVPGALCQLRAAAE
jgi:hypothetical protein